MSDLANTPCQACDHHSVPLAKAQWPALLAQLPGWAVEHHDGSAQLTRTYTFKNFREALALANAVGEIAEAEGHHPALLTEWGRLRVSWWTHSAKGLHLNDFIMAARTERLAQA